MCDMIDCIRHLLLQVTRTGKQIQKQAEPGVVGEKEITLGGAHSHAHLAIKDVA